ncbi:MAG: kelch repeat-containing protein [Planctomycetota bacterium]
MRNRMLALAAVFAAVPVALCHAQDAQWTQVSGAVNPSARRAAVMVWDEAGRRLVMVFGADSNGFKDDMWVHEGPQWRELMVPGVHPEPRVVSAIAYDPVRRLIVIQGGANGSHDNGGWFDDTWVFDGTSWRQLTPPASPPRLAGHAMVYDPVRGEIVLFGGVGPTNYEIAETWVFDGTTWTRRTPSVSPPSRYYHSMVFDCRRGVVVLFGGRQSGGTDLNDVWEWDGTSWTERTPTSPPAGRAEMVGVYDEDRGVCVYFGGTQVGGGYPAETLEWDGTAWTVRTGIPSPPDRTHAQAAYDPIRRAMVLFGGSCRGTHLDDTWEHSVDARVRRGRLVAALAGRGIVRSGEATTFRCIVVPIGGVPLGSSGRLTATLRYRAGGTWQTVAVQEVATSPDNRFPVFLRFEGVELPWEAQTVWRFKATTSWVPMGRGLALEGESNEMPLHRLPR